HRRRSVRSVPYSDSLQWHGDLRNHTAGLVTVDRQTPALTVQPSESPSDVFQPDAFRRAGIHADASIRHTQAKQALRFSRVHSDLAPAQGRLDAMLQGILHQGLQQQRRESCVPELLRYRNRIAQPHTQSQARDAQQGIDQAQLLAERRGTAPRAPEAHPQVLVQVLQNQLGGLRLRLDDTLGVGQGVEQKMRLDLRLQQSQLRGGFRLQRL